MSTSFPYPSTTLWHNNWVAAASSEYCMRK